MRPSMNFGKVDHLIVFGGSRLFAEFAVEVKKEDHFRLSLISSMRQFEERLYPNGTTLGQFLENNGLKCHVATDINTDPYVLSSISSTSLGLGFGEAWSFSKPLIDMFEGRLLDLMGIRLPQYRGGAHYTWQILRRNRIGCCNLQIINEDMVQGEFDSGEIVKTKEYFFPATARIPEDYFNAAVKEEIDFLKEFLLGVKAGREFQLTRLQEQFSIYFPRLYTKKHAFIDWSWDTKHIESFICAFDDPYPGAMTFSDGQKVRLKKCFAEYNDGSFHPFQSGLIYKIDEKAVYVASLSGTIIVSQVLDENDNNIMSTLKTGGRFFTPLSMIEEAMQFSASYNAHGITE